jgi:membrane protein
VSTADEADKREKRTWLQRFNAMLAEWEVRVWGAGDEGGGRPLRYFQRWLQILDRAIVGFVNHGNLNNASALTYTTLLSIIPFLAILFALLKTFDYHNKAYEAVLNNEIINSLMATQSDLLQESMDRISRRVVLVEGGVTPPGIQNAALPDALLNPGNPFERGFGAQQTPLPFGPTVADPAGGGEAAAAEAAEAAIPIGNEDGMFDFQAILDLTYEQVENTNFGSLGFFAFVALFLTSLAMISKIENTMNRAWSIKRGRPFIRKVGDFMNLMFVFTLALIGMTSLVTSKLLNVGDDDSSLALILKTITALLPIIMIFPVLIFVYFYIPNTRVKWNSAVSAGLITGCIFLFLQYIYFQFLMPFQSESKSVIYGAFASVVFLISWIYFSWCVVLLGVEITSAHQNIRDLRRRRRVWNNTPIERETTGLRIAALLARPLLERGKQRLLDVGDLADRLSLPPEPISDMIDLFVENGLIAQTADDGGYLLAHSPETISMLDLLHLVRYGTMDPRIHANAQIGESMNECEKTLRDISLKTLAGLPVEEIQSIPL